MAPVLKSVIRLDSVPVTNTYFTPEGFLVDKPILTSTGIFEYANPDGSIRKELRLPEEVFDVKSLKSYKGKPIIITHDAGLIDKENVHDNQIGTVLTEGERSGDNVVAEIIIHDTDEMKQAGLKELSLGYNLDLDETPGEWNGQHYDAIQRNIRINHLALVREARAGEKARLNIDSRDKENALKGGKTMGATKKTRSTRHGDSVLSKEEFAKAIDEYNKRKAQREATDAEDVVEEEVKETPETVEDKVAEVKANRDRRDEAGDPKDEEEALGVIARQDEDLDSLFDIIDTLLAERDFKPEDKTAIGDGCDEDKEKLDGTATAGIDDINKIESGDADDEEQLPVEEEKKEDDVILDADEEPEEIKEEDVTIEGPNALEDEETEEDADDEVIEEKENVEEVPDDTLDDEELDADDFPEEDDEEEDKKPLMNADSMDAAISRGIRDHMIMGNYGRAVGLKNLEYKSIKSAKKAIISKVRPDMRLDGKTDTYINAAFDMAKKEIRSMSKKGTAYQKKQMFNKDSRESKVNEDSAMTAREKMIERQHKR